MARRAYAQPAFDITRRLTGHEEARARSAKRQLAMRRWKGKQRAAPRAEWANEGMARRDEGDGGSDGVVLDLSMSGDGIWEAVYTVPVQVGSNNQTFDLQVDMGSSDLWIAADSCSSSACKKAKTYDPSSSSSANQSTKDFSIQYLSGAVSGPIYWDSVVLGGYEITSQALAAATSVQNESLSSDYSGILGLALTADSVIASEIPPVEDSDPDGQTMASNLFSSTPSDTAPSQFFLSLLLDRPGSSRVPAVLGIGMHPSDDEFGDGMTLDPSAVSYSTPTAERNGIHWWKSELRAITVYTNGTANKVSIGSAVSGSVFPEAVLDSGVPYIISTPSIANAVWGALGISPSSDGNYYLPCTTPLNMSITLDDRTEIPLHPLDLTAEPSGQSGSSQCVGMFMQSSVLENPSGFGDIILGVPFLRNVYTVMAYQSVSANGTVSGNSSSQISPYLGLLNITNATLAMEEFNQVRIENKPLDGSVGATSDNPVSLSGGDKAGIVIGGIFVLCALIVGLRFLYNSRLNKKRKEAIASAGDEVASKEAYAMAAFRRDLRDPRSHSFVPSEDTEATLTDPFSRLDKKYESFHTKMQSLDEGEFGVLRKSKTNDSDESDGERDNGQVIVRESTLSWIDAYAESTPPLMGEWRPPTEHEHERSFSASSTLSAHNLLSRPSPRKWRSDPAPDEFGGLPTRRALAASSSGRDSMSRRSGSINRVEDLTLVGTGPSRTSPRMHAHKISRSSNSSSSSEVDETTALTAPPVSITRPPPRGTPSPSPSPTSTSFPRPTRRASGPRPLSQMSRVINADDPDRRSSTYSR